ncbi:hypothetical protein [Paenibacillus sp. Soil787]|uniref:hypothetical protein n=1 Tax=Paenibacillus sp. Soil787 TaxID=1736411 RepID=UPI0006F57758|nr:hypothetical protein [Paenibacillus sp. Soil787]KRF43825.1 hypothetical protein ASG93_02600 [Paenibacillus sp. Soil787]
MNHADLWWQGITPDLPDISGKLPLVRELLKQERAREADRVLPSKEVTKNRRTARNIPAIGGIWA